MTTQLLILAAIVILQNGSFTLVSRARNSGSYLYNAIASVFSNGIWLWVAQQVVTKPNDMPTFVTYVIGAVIGSVAMQWVSIRFLEKKKPAPVQKPTVGRIVWFTEYGSIYPAIITYVYNETCVKLDVFGWKYSERDSVVQGSGNYQWDWPKIK